MTKEDKIKEVMELVDSFEEDIDSAAYYSGRDDDERSSRCYKRATESKKELEAKLRELIN